MRFYFFSPRIFGGFRAGISTSAQDLAKLVAPAPVKREGQYSNFLYVASITTDNGVCMSKIGVSGNPTNRIIQLQTGQPHKITLSWAATPAERANQIEQLAHDLLEAAHTRLQGEWFLCSVVVAKTAVELAANKLGIPFLTVMPKSVDEVIKLSELAEAAAKITPTVKPPPMLFLPWLGGVMAIDAILYSMHASTTSMILVGVGGIAFYTIMRATDRLF